MLLLMMTMLPSRPYRLRIPNHLESRPDVVVVEEAVEVEIVVDEAMNVAIVTDR
jgi:hypothetical protein